MLQKTRNPYGLNDALLTVRKYNIKFNE